MILVVLVAISAIVGNIILWRRISELDERILAYRISLSARLDDQECVHAAALVALEARIRDNQEIIASLVAYLDDVPQNFAFNKDPATSYHLTLPDRLRLSLMDMG